MQWYRLDKDDVLARLKSTPDGLASEEASSRLKQYGPNTLGEQERLSRLEIIAHQLKSPLIYILLVAAVVTFFLGEFIDMGVILAVVVLNAIIGYTQESKAEAGVRALKKMLVLKANVLRDGKVVRVDGSSLVPGDVVLLSSGMKVPADIRLVSEYELSIEEAMLTGESVPSDKFTAAIAEENLPPGDRKNTVFMGTVVLSGRGRGVVVETGKNTEIGRIAEVVRVAKSERSPLQVRMDSLARMLGLVVFLFSVFVFAGGLLSGTPISEVFLTAVAMAVSAVPEGLPVAVTIAMAIGVSRMSRRNAIIRRLVAVETLGSTTVIGSDKTGTLTKNEMTVTLVNDCEHTYRLTGSGYDPAGEIIHEERRVLPGESLHLEQLLRIGMLCNESYLFEEAGQYKVGGDPTEGALIVAAIKGGLNPEEEKLAYPQVDLKPFESERGYMATLNGRDNEKWLYVKGAPEQVLPMCSVNSRGEELDHDEMLAIAREFGSQGLRVLAMAYKKVSPDAFSIRELKCCDVESGLYFAGFQGMLDPPRPEAMDAVQNCRRAGIRTVMITGDHPDTAVVIAGKLGIDDGGGVMTGREIEAIDDDELYGRIDSVSVYARVAPEHKLRIVRQFIRKGNIVAVTGDGVNDAPALKAAHIGVAMGREGTDVAKEASDMVLADDNFASIFAAVEEGRVVYENIRKVTLFLISCGLGELIAITASVLLGWPIPFIPAQILWLNLVTNGLQDVALAFEPEEPGIIDRPPRNPREGIFSPLMVQRTVLMGLILALGTMFMFWLELKAGAPIERARTVALTTMVFFQFYQAFNCRSERQSMFRMSLKSNVFLTVSLTAAFFAQLAVLYVPSFQWVFRTVPLSLAEWMEIAIVSSTVVAAVEFDKWRRARRA